MTDDKTDVTALVRYAQSLEAEVERLRERVSEAESSLYAWDNERRASYWHLYPTPIDATLKDVDWRFAIDPTLTTLHRDRRSDCT